MNAASTHPSRRGGFTLIELLVTMAILSIILTMALQVTESARNAIRITESMSSNDAIARETFDRINRDLSQMVVREDARIELQPKTGNDEFAFLTQSKGFNSSGLLGERNVSLVSYSMDAAGVKLLRGSRGHLFSAPPGDALKLDASLSFPAISADNLQVLSNNVIRIELEYLIQNASAVTLEITPPPAPPATAPPATQKLRGLVVTLVTLDDRGRRALKPDRVDTLAAKFPDAVSGSDTLKAWSRTRDEFAKSGIPGLPKDVLQSIRCYQRTFLIP